MADIDRIEEFETPVRTERGILRREPMRTSGPAFTPGDIVAGILIAGMIWGPLAAGSFAGW